MPKLPTIEARRRSPVSREGVVREQGVGQVAEAVEGVAGQMKGVVDQYQDNENRMIYAQAKADMVVADVDARKKLEGDTDFGTHEERYNSDMSAAKKKATESFRSNRDREMFDIEEQASRARGRQGIGKSARAGLVDQRRATTGESLEALRDGALADKSEGSGYRAIQAAHEQIDAAVAAGVYSADEGRAKKEDWAEGFAAAKIDMMPPAERIEALENPGIADVIDPDKRQAMLDDAIKENEIANSQAESQIAADAIYGNGGSIEEQLATAREIEDPVVRDKTRDRLKSRHSTDRILAEQRRVDDLEAAYNWLDTEGNDINDFPASLQSEISPSDWKKIKEYAQPGDVETNFATWNTLNKMKVDNPELFASVYLDDFRSSISKEDLKAFSDDQNNIVGSYQLQNDKQAVDMAAIAIGLDPTPDNKSDAEKMGKWSHRYTQEANQFKSLNGRLPNADERKKILSDMAREAVTAPQNITNWIEDSTRAFAITVEGVPDDEIDLIVENLVKRNKAATPANIKRGWELTQQERGK